MWRIKKGENTYQRAQRKRIEKFNIKSLEELEQIDISKLKWEAKEHLIKLIEELKNRKINYPILDFKLQPHQQEIVDAIADKNNKYVLLIWWNWSWKTITAVYVDILMLLGKDCQKYWLPYIWEARQILVVTKTSDSITTNLEPYFLGDWTLNSSISIPKREIKNVSRDPSTKSIRKIELHNWNEILFRTYDAGQARLEWSSPDFIHLDELPEREDIFIELLRGTRKPHSQILLSFTPTKFNAAVHEYFYWQNSEAVKNRTYIRQVDSLENKYADHTWLEWLSEEERKIRRYWHFIPPTWLVYNQFYRNRNLIDFISPRELGQAKFYWALDFWVNHPMAFLFIAVDEDWHIIVLDMIYERNLLLKDLVSRVREKTRELWISLEYIIADTADKRSRLELEQHWLHTVPADKFTKWDTNMSNRRAWILKVNWLFEQWFLYVTERCKDLVRELETHAYKWNWSEDVEKTNDDALRSSMRLDISFLVISPKMKLRNYIDSLKERLNHKWLKDIKSRLDYKIQNKTFTTSALSFVLPQTLKYGCLAA